MADLKSFQSTLKVSNRKKVEIVDDLKKRGSTAVSFSTCFTAHKLLSFLVLKHLRCRAGYAPMVKESKKKAAGDLQSAEQEAQQELDEEEAKTGITAYDYLLNMPIMSLTLERVNTLQAERDSKDQELGALRSASFQPALSIPASLISYTKCPPFAMPSRCL